MAWVRQGDTADTHRKVLRAMAKDPVRGTAVVGCVTLCLGWSSRNSQDYWVSESYVTRTWGAEGRGLMRDAQACELVRPGRTRRHGENGWMLDDSDPELLHIRLAEEVKLDRDKARATRQVEPRREVRLRDGDQCRYCGKSISWTDRKSARGGTYDHPDPADRETFVVACFGCNRTKYDRTAEQWAAAGGHALLPPPALPLIGKHTAEQFGVPMCFPTTVRAHPARPVDAATTRPGSQPATAPPDAAAGAQGTTIPDAATGAQGDLPDLGSIQPRGADRLASGRDGPGQVGSRGPDPPRRPKRSRGSRGKRNPS